MLLQTARGVGSRADVERGVAHGGTEDIHRVEGGDGLGLDGHDSADKTRSQDVVRRVLKGGRVELCLCLCCVPSSVDRPRLGAGGSVRGHGFGRVSA